MEKKFSDFTIELIRGDIASQPDMDAIVNAANAELKIGGGVAGAIHSKGDPELERETRPLAPISPGQAVITSAPHLPNSHVIHCLGPVYGRDKPEDKLLADCYRNALQKADENNITSIAFPAISTGAFGYPTEAAARVALKTVLETAPELNTVKQIRFVLFGKSDYEIHKKVLESL